MNDQIKNFVIGFIEEQKRLDQPPQLESADSLIDKHLLDSIEFVELLESLEQKFSIEYDAGNIEFAKLATLSGLQTHFQKKENQ